MSLEDLMQRADVWRGGFAPPPSGLASGYPELDAVLNGGWPQGALTEILIDRAGIGELRLLLPALVRLTQGDRWLAFVAPPYIPYAPALKRAGVNLDRERAPGLRQKKARPSWRDTATSATWRPAMKSPVRFTRR